MNKNVLKRLCNVEGYPLRFIKCFNVLGIDNLSCRGVRLIGDVEVGEWRDRKIKLTDEALTTSGVTETRPV